MTIHRPQNRSEFTSAIQQANFGDVIALQGADKGAIYGTPPAYPFGEIYLPNKGTPPTGTDADYITITTDDPEGTPVALSEYPVKRTRITSEMAARMPVVVAEGSTPLFRIGRGAKYWKLSGLNIRNNAANPYQTGVFIDNEGMSSLAEVPHHLIFEKLWIHPHEETGQPLSSANVNRSAENAMYLTARDSIIRNLAIQGFVGRVKHNNNGEAGRKMTSAGILVPIYAENLLIENNLNEAWTYSLFCGGSSMPSWLVTHGGLIVSASSDIVIRLDNVNGLAVGDPISLRVNGIWGSTFVKTISGNEVQLETPARHSFDGGNTAVAIEGDPMPGDPVRWKGLQPNRILSRRNLYAHYPEWPGFMDGDPAGKGYEEIKAGQVDHIGDTFFGGTGPTLTVRNQDGDFCWAKVDVLFQDCMWEESDRIFTSFLRDSTPTGRSRVRWHNCLVLGLCANTTSEGAMRGGELSGATTGGIDCEIDHVTVAWSKAHTAGMLKSCARGFTMFYNEGRGTMERFRMTNSVIPAGPMFVEGGTVQQMFPNAVIDHNVFVNADSYPLSEVQQWWPWPGNRIASSYVGLFARPGATLGKDGDYRPAPGGLLDKAGSDGTDIGVDYVKLAAGLGRDPLTGVIVDVPAPTPPPPTPSPTPPQPPVPEPPLPEPTPAPAPPPPDPVPPIPEPVPTPAPTPGSGFLVEVVRGYVVVNDQKVPGARVQLVGKDNREMLSREGDGFFWFYDVVEGSQISVSKDGLTFPLATVHKDTPEQLYWIVGTVTQTPPAPEPPQPQPTPTPTPTPVPVPACSITAPPSITIPRNSTGTIAVTFQNLTQPTTVTVAGSDGQVGVSPLTKTVSGTSASIQFSIRVKKQSRTITFHSQCGSAVVKVNVV